MVRQTLFLAMLLGIAAAPAAQANVILTDNGSGSGHVVAFQYYSDAGVTGGVSICAACGNPGAAIDFEVTVGQTQTVSYLGGILNTLLTYNPQTQGAIGSIATSTDKNFSDTSATNYNNRYRLLVQQGGSFYASAIDGPILVGPGSTGFLNLSASGLRATDFQKIDPTTGTFSAANPDFAGSTLTFGVAQLLGSSGVANTSLSAIYDNVVINIAPAAVPEPGGMLATMVGLGLLAGAVARRRAG